MNPNSDSTAPAFNTTTESENQHSTLFSIGIRQMLAQPKIKDSFLLSLCATLSHLLVCWIICTVIHSQSRIQEVLSLPGFLVLNTSIPTLLFILTLLMAYIYRWPQAHPPVNRQTIATFALAGALINAPIFLYGYATAFLLQYTVSFGYSLSEAQYIMFLLTPLKLLLIWVCVFLCMLAIGQLFAQKTTFSKPEQIGYQPMLGLFAALLVLAFLQTQPSEILIAQSLVPMLKSMFEFEEYGTVVAVLQIVAQLITLLFIALLIPLAYAFASTALERKRLSGLTLRYSISAVLASLVILYLIGLAISFVVLKLITSFKFLYFAQEFFGLLIIGMLTTAIFLAIVVCKHLSTTGWRIYAIAVGCAPAVCCLLILLIQLTLSYMPASLAFAAAVTCLLAWFIFFLMLDYSIKIGMSVLVRTNAHLTQSPRL